MDVNTIKDQLQSVIKVLTSVSIECVSSYFSIECVLKENWKIVDCLNGKFDYILAMGGINEDYQALLYLGLPQESISIFTGEQGLPAEDVFDIFGEFTNTYLGMLSDVELFTNNFGILLQGIPILYQNGQTFLPFIPGVEGRLHVDENWIYIGFAIKKA